MESKRQMGSSTENDKELNENSEINLENFEKEPTIEELKLEIQLLKNELLMRSLAEGENIARRKGLTPNMLFIKDATREFIEQHGYSPTLRELMAISGKKSTSEIDRIINSLIDRGHMEKLPATPRSLIVID